MSANSRHFTHYNATPIPNEMKTSIIKVFSYYNSQLKGALSNPFFEQDMYFDSFIQLIFMLNELHDTLNFPQNSMEIRSFKGNLSKPKPAPLSSISQPNTIPADATCIACFKLDILFRQNASWQGSLFWFEQDVSSHFRSVLEFIMLIDDALSG